MALFRWNNYFRFVSQTLTLVTFDRNELLKIVRSLKKWSLFQEIHELNLKHQKSYNKKQGKINNGKMVTTLIL